jgi:hypothetical protein
MFTGLFTAVGGVSEYDGSYNATFSYECKQCYCAEQEGCSVIDGGNLTMTGETQTPNYVTANGMITQGIGAIFSLMGVALIYYGATIPKAQPV